MSLGSLDTLLCDARSRRYSPAKAEGGAYPRLSSPRREQTEGLPPNCTETLGRTIGGVKEDPGRAEISLALS
jgi:hypothetical protein